ncbi:dyslexia-associated protein KIAA0319-like protein isoform X2 [Mercenaria mercenaria]|uniref:dyslexia-associated protein KIAA0319-like protein isoform X2 n=1 Tax=Mercenaria mercenaria TaxID=6596 RepID=UPI00234FA7BF|nr:dyslexia-associated protein KIAA0319-like protein isoform X2 [Mercenaria mercenaria]
MESSSLYRVRNLKTLMLKWILLNLLVSDCLCQICDQTAETLPLETMKQHLHPTAIPRGRVDAGYFEEDTEAEDEAECLVSCCEKPLCNVAWYSQGKCFTIECNEQDEAACDPIPQSSAKYNRTLFIQVRSINTTRYTPECNLSKNTCGENYHCILNSNKVRRCECMTGFVRKSSHSKTCIPASTEDSSSGRTTQQPDIKDCRNGVTQCGKHKECVVWGITSNAGTCHCVAGYSEDKHGKCVLIQDCEFGVTNCGKNRECVHVGSRTKSGTCECVNGYIESDDGECIEGKVNQETEGTSIGVDNKTSAPPKVDVTPRLEPTTQKVEMLTVSAGDNKEVQLPMNKVTLTAFALPEAKDEEYKYDWTMEAHPEAEEYGNMDGRNTNTIKLDKLIAGLYTFRVQVTGINKFGEARVNVTVKPPARQNQPPVAVITPTNLQVKLPNSAILDGSDSTDDDKIVRYQWDVVSGPLQDKSITGDTAILKLTDLVPGNYTLKLTVTDSDGATNATTANVTVIKETDYPPKANAGSDVVIHLPQKSVVLYGNLSTDDKGIVSYEWIKASGDNLAADTQGARTSELHLSNLEVGDYTFTLKVTDSAGQVSTADVHVYVKPEQNTPPVARTGGSIETSLPLDNILLDGSNSTDDQKITSFLWEQTGGPTALTIHDADKAEATASGDIKKGKYVFKLTVKDKEQLTSSATLDVEVKQVQNEAPVADAGGDVVVQLPQMLVLLDGSKSSDDHKITEYNWVREPKSLSAGDILNSSDHQAVLQLANLVAGKYMFTLTVVDAEGLSSSDKASVLVKPAGHKNDLLELILDADITKFTEENKKNLEGQLALLLPKMPSEGAAVISIQSITETSSAGNLRILFYAMNVMRDTRVYRNGKETLKVLKKKLLSSPYVLEFKVVNIDTLVCQNNCSDHGHCDMRTKLCVCEAFWTQNFLLYWLHGDSNCDWSILYVVIVCFLIVISSTGALWACVCCWQRKRCPCHRCRLRSKKRHRYSLLQDVDDETESIALKKNKIQNSSVMISESDFSTEEETLFVNQKKTNGHLGQMNGISKQHLKNSLKT